MGDKRDRGLPQKNGERRVHNARGTEKEIRPLRFNIIYPPKIVKEILKLPENIRERILKKLDTVRCVPHHFFERLEGRTDYKLRVGDYRVIADIHADKRVIEVTLIEHRGKVYKNLP